MALIKEKKITQKYSKVMVTQSLYSLALYVFINKNIESDTLFLLGDNINFSSIKEELSNYIIYDVKNAGPKNITEWLLLSRGIRLGRFKSIDKYINDNNIVYGHDHISLSPLFFNRITIIIEDGLSNYIENYTNLTRNQKIKRLLKIPYKNKGYNKETENIYLTGMLDIPNELRSKCILVDRLSFINELKYILNGVFFSTLEILGNYQLLITQPLSEDGIITEKEKIQLYRDIVDDAVMLIIKPHPRELTNYKEYFESAVIISNEKLAESLFENRYITDIITIFSSALSDYPFKRNVKVHIKGTMDNKKLISRIGEIKETYKIYNF